MKRIRKLRWKFLKNLIKGYIPSKLSDIENDAFFIEAIVNEGKQVPLPPAETLKVCFNLPDAHYEFITRVLDGTNERLTLKIARPDEKEIVRLQRREYLRSQCSIKATFKYIYSANNVNRNHTYQGTLINISAGGALLDTEAKVLLNDALEIKFQYINEGSVPVAFSFMGNVARIDIDTIHETVFAIKFSYISEKDRCMLMKIAEEYYRKLRKRMI